MNRGLAVLTGCLLLVGTVGFVAAHGTVTVEFESETISVAAGGQTQVDVLVRDADDGVRAAEFTVSTTDGEMVRISDVRVAGSPSAVNTTIFGNGTRATVAASGLDLDGPTTRLATVTLGGESTGTASLSITTSSVLPPAGAPYLPTQSGTAEVVVSAAESDGGVVALIGVVGALGILIPLGYLFGRRMDTP